MMEAVPAVCEGLRYSPRDFGEAIVCITLTRPVHDVVGAISSAVYCVALE